MRRLTMALAAVALLSSCGTASLYYWGGESYGTTKYEQLAYKYSDRQTPESLCKLICLYEEMVSKPVGKRRVPPPGICAEYAYLISKPEVVAAFIEKATDGQKSKFNTDDFAAFFSQRAEELFELELSLYPESATFIKPLFEKIKSGKI